MKKIWSYLTLFFIGLSVGLLVAVKTAGDDYKAYISKLKQKGKGNTLESDLDMNLTPQTKLLSKRKLRRIEKKKRKSLEKLDEIV